MNSRCHRNVFNRGRSNERIARNITSARVGKRPTWVRKEGEIRTCRCMISFAIDSMGAADACVGVGLVGEGGRARRSSVREIHHRVDGRVSDGRSRST